MKKIITINILLISFFVASPHCIGIFANVSTQKQKENHSNNPPKKKFYSYFVAAPLAVMIGGLSMYPTQKKKNKKLLNALKEIDEEYLDKIDQKTKDQVLSDKSFLKNKNDLFYEAVTYKKAKMVHWLIENTSYDEVVLTNTLWRITQNKDRELFDIFGQNIQNKVLNKAIQEDRYGEVYWLINEIPYPQQIKNSAFYTVIEDQYEDLMNIFDQKTQEEVLGKQSFLETKERLLSKAIHSKKAKIAQWLIERGTYGRVFLTEKLWDITKNQEKELFDVFSQSTKNEILVKTAKGNKIRELTWLINHITYPQHKKNSALYIAIEGQHEELIDIFDERTQNEIPRTPKFLEKKKELISKAIKKKKKKIVRWLIENGKYNKTFLVNKLWDIMEERNKNLFNAFSQDIQNRVLNRAIKENKKEEVKWLITEIAFDQKEKSKALYTALNGGRRSFLDIFVDSETRAGALDYALQEGEYQFVDFFDEKVVKKAFVVSAKRQKEEEERMEEHLICPICSEFMTEAVVTPAGHTYQEKAIKRHIEINPVEPMVPDSSLSKDQLIPNYLIRKQVREYLKKHPQ